MIPQIGKYATLEVVKEVSFGWYLDGGPLGEILLPKREALADMSKVTELEVFLYCDSEDRVVATTLKPKAIVGQFAYLKVKAVSAFGAFMDWGLAKDLLVPLREQRLRMEINKHYVVYIYFDTKTDRIVGSAKLSPFFEKDFPQDFPPHQPLQLLIYQETPIGYKAVVDNKYNGLLYKTEVFRPIHIGEVVEGYLKTLREDGKLDLILQKGGFGIMRDTATQTLLDALVQHGGTLPLTDETPPEAIYAMLGISKKAFKKCVGMLYKQKRVTIEPSGIRLL